MNVGELGFAEMLPAASRASAVNGSAVDLASIVSGQFSDMLAAGPGGYSLMGLLSVGTAGTTMDVKFQYSADGSTGWTDISGAAFTTVTTAVAEKIHFTSPERYIRAISHTQTGTFVFGVQVVGKQRYSN